METYNSIEVTKQLVKDGKISQEIAETIFPQLKESDDERIRKAILELVKQSSHILNPTNQKSMIAWLEKQGKQNLANSAKTCKDEQKPAWSDEDESKRICACKFLDDAKHEINYAVNHKDDIDECITWLKSLKERYTWKPSDEQMEYLAKAITTLGNEGDNKTSAILCELRANLKKLKG